MKPEAQRIAIAQACGWTYDEGMVKPWKRAGKGPSNHRSVLPNYLNDLNAMNSAERYASEHIMDADQWEHYGKLLEKLHPTAALIAPGGGCSIDYGDFATLMTTVTAAQRAEAFLRTIGKWKEEPVDAKV